MMIDHRGILELLLQSWEVIDVEAFFFFNSRCVRGSTVERFFGSSLSDICTSMHFCRLI